MIFLRLAILWLVLTGSFAYSMLAHGAFAITATYLLVNKAKIQPKFNHLNIVQLFFYLIWLGKEILISAWSVTKLCWRWHKNTASGFAWLDTKLAANMQILYAQSITLTPGTITILVEEHKLLVHALDTGSMAELQSNQMEQRLNKILN